MAFDLGRVFAEARVSAKLSLSSFQQFFLGRSYTPESMYDWSLVARWFEGYEDPFTVFKVVINGQEYWYSVAELCFFSSMEAIQAEETIRTTLRALINDGVLSTSFVEPPLWVMNSPNVQFLRGYDARWQNPSAFFTFPVSSDFYFKHDELAYDTIPKPKVKACELFLGPKFFEKDSDGNLQYSNARLINDMIVLWSAILQKHEAANCNPKFAPFISLGSSMHDNSGLFEFFDQNAPGTRERLREPGLLFQGNGLDASRISRMPQASTREVNRYTYTGLYGVFSQNSLDVIGSSVQTVCPLEMRYTRLIEPPGRSRFGYRDRQINNSFFVNRQAPSVLASLDRRNRVYARTGYQSWITDVATEFLQTVVMANAVRLVPCHVLLHGNMQFYHNCLNMAYGTTLFTNAEAINQYVANVEAENNIRRGLRGQATLDAIGYTALAGMDIFAPKTMGTAMLAAGNGQQSGSRPVASVMKAFDAISTAIDPPQDIERRDLFTLQDGVPPRWYENNWMTWLDPRLVVDERPFKRTS